jgi:hypothetical protein
MLDAQVLLAVGEGGGGRVVEQLVERVQLGAERGDAVAYRLVADEVGREQADDALVRHAGESDRLAAQSRSASSPLSVTV